MFEGVALGLAAEVGLVVAFPDFVVAGLGSWYSPVKRQLLAKQ